MNKAIGLIKTQGKVLVGIEVLIPKNTYKIGQIILLDNDVAGFVVCKDHNFERVVNAVGDILSKILKVQKIKNISFFESVVLHRESIEHFIRVHEDEKELKDG